MQKNNLQLILMILFIAFCLKVGIFGQTIEQMQSKTNLENDVLIPQDQMVKLSNDANSKILSGKLLNNISKKLALNNNPLNSNAQLKEKVVIYMDSYPSAQEISQLTARNIDCYLELWTPPMENHPYGFFIADMPISVLNEVLAFAFVKKLDTAEYECLPQNNNGAIAINSDDVWTDGYNGNGVKIAVLDSGLDDAYDGTDLPLTYDKKDYSSFPTLDDDVLNTVTGHGTHVAGSVLGRGLLSNGRSDEGNGSTPFKGSAPNADLIFLKIGSDATGSATSAAMIAAMDAAVNTYNADILSMSYGGWYTYHDGSSTTEQKVDWVYSQGVPFFISAGNSGDDDQHYSGTVPANGSTDFIQINTQSGSTLTFNLVWFDGLGTNNDLSMKYYDNTQTELISTTQYATTESPRGTESKYSNYNYTVGAGVYYVKVFNASASSQDFHIYFDNWGYASITFAIPDPEYTIGQPASADFGFAVGAWTTRKIWYDYNGSGPYFYNSNQTVDDIATFSSRGPRINGGVTKPNIVAPGTAIISLKDTKVYTVGNGAWIDNDGLTGAGDANYYVMQGTSMACPIAAGAAALLLDKFPAATPAMIYQSIQTNASSSGTGALPNSTWGYGKLDIYAASIDAALPVELTTFTANAIVEDKVLLEWETATEVNNYGFEIERKNSSSKNNNSNWETIGFVKGSGNSNSPKLYSYNDNLFSGGSNFIYRLKQLDINGQFEYSNIVEVEVMPTEYTLNQNYPNPFNPSTKISFRLPQSSKVSLIVYDVIGREVKRLLNDDKEAGLYSIEFNAESLPSGVYYYTLSAGDFIQTKKMLLLK